MDDKTMTLEVVTPEKIQLKEKIVSLTVPTVEGSIGILYNHAPIVTLVSIGQLKYRKDEKDEKVLVVTDGVLEMHENKITVLVNAAERPEDICPERAERARERARKRLDQKSRDVDFARAEASLKRAMMRLKTAGKQ